MAKIKLIVENTSEMIGLRVDKALSLIPEIGTRSRVENLLHKKLIRVNQVFPKNSYKIKLSDVLEIEIPDVPTSELMPYNFPLDIIYEDNDILVINKPSGLVVHPAAGHEQDTLVNALIHYTKNLSMKFNEHRPGIVHRIDKETSGLLVVAKNDMAHENLSLQFKNKTSHRLYEAVAWGHLPEDGVVKSWLGRHPVDRKKISSFRNSKNIIIRDSAKELEMQKNEIPNFLKWAVTHFSLKKYINPFSLVELKLETGRTHQIRVHLSELGHPLVGDVVYGSDKRLSQQQGRPVNADVKNLNRFLLHAKELGFTHPTTQKNMLFSVDWPSEDLMLLKKWNLK